MPDAICPAKKLQHHWGQNTQDRQRTNSDFVTGQVAKGFSELAWVYSLQGSAACFRFSKSLEQADQCFYHIIGLQCMGSFKLSLLRQSV